MGQKRKPCDDEIRAVSHGMNMRGKGIRINKKNQQSDSDSPLKLPL